MNDVLNVLSELEQWVEENHQHHFNCEGDDVCCPDSTLPYVNSIELMRKIRELKGIPRLRLIDSEET